MLSTLVMEIVIASACSFQSNMLQVVSVDKLQVVQGMAKVEQYNYFRALYLELVVINFKSNEAAIGGALY